jgi:hypothetical protein
MSQPLPIAAAEYEYRITIRYPHGQRQSYPAPSEEAALADFDAMLDDAGPDVEVSILRRRIVPWEPHSAAMGRKGAVKAKSDPMSDRELDGSPA